MNDLLAQDLFELFTAMDWSLILTIVLITSVSATLGRSLILLANQVPPWRFAGSLIIAALTFAFTFFVWVGAIYIVGRRFPNVTLTLHDATALTASGYLPLVLAIFGLMPYLGSCLVRILYVTSAALLYIILMTLGFGWQGALIVLGAAAVIMGVAQFTLLRPLIWLQNWVAGRSLVRNYRKILTGEESR